MGLKVTSPEQASKVLTLFHGNLIDEDVENGLSIDGFITFDEMADIVDYLRQPSDTKSELFEECWKAYQRKGSKKKAKEYWNKLKDSEKDAVLPHIKAYTQSRELQYFKDFERYLRDKIFNTIVFKGNTVLYDPTKIGKGESFSEVYMPTTGGSLTWNDYYHCFMYTGYWDGIHIADGYDDNNRPNGASITLNNGRGTITWSRETKSWNKV